MASATARSPSFDALTLPEQIHHVQDLWDQIAARAAEMPLSDAWREELDRRLADDDADPDGGTPWEVVRERIRQRR